MAESSQLKLFSQSTFSAPVIAELLTTSPTINLAATVNADQRDHLLILRGNGQSVSKTTEKGHKIGALRWKSDGQFLAVGWGDGTVRLMGLESTKAVHRIDVAKDKVSKAASDDGDSNKTSITYIAWARNLTGKRHFGRAKVAASKLRGLLSEGLDDFEKQDDELLDLPHALTFLEIDTALPKLSPLPVTGFTGDDSFVFSSRASLDFMFSPLRPEDSDAVDIMVVGTGDGRIHLSIYDSFIIGSFNPAFHGGKGPNVPLQLCLHASHSEVSTHSLLMRPADGDRTTVYLVPMDLRFVSYSPVNLSLLASKSTTLQKLLRYIKQTQVHMVSEWKTTRDLPSRFLQNVQEDMDTNHYDVSIMQALYHTVVTGHVYNVVREWLVDGLAERGHKRWDKAVVEGLKSLRSLIHENMIPALERCALILSRLSGIAKFHEAGDPIGLTSAEIARLIDVVASLSLVCHKALLIVMEELDLFYVFSTWLRFEIDRQASSSMLEELSEKEATLNTAKVLAYIEKYLTSSPLATYLDSTVKEKSNDWDHVDEGSSLLDMVERQLKSKEAGLLYVKTLPQVEFLVDYLTRRAESVFQNIAEAEKRSVRFVQPVKMSLPGETITKSDMRMIAVPKPDGVDSVTYVALATEEYKSGIHLYRMNVQIINGISSVVHAEFCEVYLGEGKMVDFKFLNDDILLALFYPEDKPPILCTVAFRSDDIKWRPHTESSGGMGWDDANDVLDSLPTFSLPEDPYFQPMHMEVKEANSARGDIPPRVCLLGNDGTTYKVFALPDNIIVGVDE